MRQSIDINSVSTYEWIASLSLAMTRWAGANFAKGLMNRSIRVLFLLLIMTVSLYARGEIGGGCGGPIGSPPYSECGTTDMLTNGDTLPPNMISAPGYSSDTYVCNNPNTSLPYVIGWGASCMTPAGAITPEGSTCVTIPNLIGEVIDTITTVGIGIDMRANFCSFSAGDINKEGALINQTFLNQCTPICNGQPTVAQVQCIKDCQSTLLRGYSVGEGTSTPLTSYGLQNPTNYTTTDLCNEAIINLERPVVDSNGNYVFYNNKQAFCPLMRCNIPTNTMISLYYDRMSARTGIMAAFGGVIGAAVSALAGSCSDLVELGDGDTSSVGLFDIIKLQGTFDADMVCTQMLFPTGYTTLACKPRSIPMTTYAPSANCYVQSTSCVTGQTHSKSFFPMTAMMMECVTDLMTNVFRTPSDSSCPQNPLSAFQNALRNIVQVLLVLYVVVFGIKVAIGGTLPKKSEIFSFILKFALVGYFAVGTSATTVDSQTGLYYFYDALINAMGEFSGMLIQGISGEGGLCQYTGYAPDYQYLSLWDALDCRVSFYLGITSPVAGGALKALTSNSLSGGMFTLIWGAFFSFYFPLVVFIICFGVFLLSIVIYLVHVYIIALITLSIMIFCGPIFIPLALFDRTKKYFNEWLSLTLSYVLYPVVITAFISIMITTFDSVIYNDCQFEQQQLAFLGNMSYWIFAPNPSATCTNSFGYIISQVTSGTASEVIAFAGGLFNFSRLIQGASELVKLLESMMLCTFFGFLFYYFSKQLSEFAADISGATNIGSQAIAPTAVADAAAKAAGDYASSGSGGKGGGDKKDDGVSVSGKGDDKKDDGVSVSGKGGASRSGIDVSEKK